jgi:hypothetical protein
LEKLTFIFFTCDHLFEDLWFDALIIKKYDDFMLYGSTFYGSAFDDSTFNVSTLFVSTLTFSTFDDSTFDVSTLVESAL